MPKTRDLDRPSPLLSIGSYYVPSENLYYSWVASCSVATKLFPDRASALKAVSGKKYHTVRAFNFYTPFGYIGSFGEIYAHGFRALAKKSTKWYTLSYGVYAILLGVDIGD